MRFSIRLNNDLPVRLYPELARAAEQAGFDQIWVSDDLFLRGVWPILSACALATSQIELGTCIVNPYTCHPAELAMQAVALDELSNGRFNLGLAAGAADFLGWVGLPQHQPLATTRNSIVALRALFAGERPASLPNTGPGWTDAAYLRVHSRPIPIYLGAMSPRMHQLIGEVANGGLPLLFPPEQYATVAARVAHGAQLAGRPGEAIDLAACIWVSVSHNRATAEQPLREKVAYYGPAFSADVLARLGLTHTDLRELAHTMQVQNDLSTATRLVSPELLRVGIAGTASDLLPRLEALVAAGARHLSFGPPLGPDLLEAIGILGREVLPHFR